MFAPVVFSVFLQISFIAVFVWIDLLYLPEYPPTVSTNRCALTFSQGGLDACMQNRAGKGRSPPCFRGATISYVLSGDCNDDYYVISRIR